MSELNIKGIEFHGGTVHVTIPIKPYHASGNEVTAIETLGIASALSDTYSKKLEERLSQFPDGVKDFRHFQTLLSKTIFRLECLIPEKTRDYIQMAWKRGRVSIDFPGAVPSAAWSLIKSDDLKLMVLATLEGQCGMCTCDKKEARKCRLRQVLKTVAPARNGGDSTGCEYQLIAIGVDSNGVEGVDDE